MVALLASSLRVHTLTLSGIVNQPIFDPDQFGELEDPLVPLGSFYFSNVHCGIVKRIAKKRNL